MRSQAARDRRAVRRERAKFMPNMSLRAYLKASAVHLEQEVENRKRNAEHAKGAPKFAPITLAVDIDGNPIDP